MKLIPDNPDELIRRITSRPLIIYGMGYVGRLISAWCDDNNIKYIFADANVEKKRLETEKEVIAPELLMKKYPNANILIASINYFDEIETNLKRMGFEDSHILSYLAFWPKNIPWEELEESVDWNQVRERAKIFAAWIDKSADSVADYSAEKNFLKSFLPAGVMYYAPDYIRSNETMPYADFSGVDSSFQVDVSSCLAVLMSFTNPEALIQYICDSTRKSVIISYVTLEKLSEINFRRSINYVNDLTEKQLVELFAKKRFALKKKAVDPFDEVHDIYLFERQNKLLDGSNIW